MPQGGAVTAEAMENTREVESCGEDLHSPTNGEVEKETVDDDKGNLNSRALDLKKKENRRDDDGDNDLKVSNFL